MAEGRRLFRKTPHPSGEGKIISEFEWFCHRWLKITWNGLWPIRVPVRCSFCNKPTFRVGFGKFDGSHWECIEAYLDRLLNE